MSVLAINDRPLDRAIKLHEIAAAPDVTVSPAVDRVVLFELAGALVVRRDLAVEHDDADVVVRDRESSIRVPSSSKSNRRNHDEFRNGDKDLFEVLRLAKRFIQPGRRETVLNVQAVAQSSWMISFTVSAQPSSSGAGHSERHLCR